MCMTQHKKKEKKNKKKQTQKLCLTYEREARLHLHHCLLCVGMSVGVHVDFLTQTNISAAPPACCSGIWIMISEGDSAHRVLRLLTGYLQYGVSVWRYNAAFHWTSEVVCLFTVVRLFKKTTSWNQNFRSERRRKLSSHQFTSFFIKTRWKLCKHHSLAVWSFFFVFTFKEAVRWYCATSPCTYLVFVLPCTYYHILHHSQPVLANSANNNNNNWCIHPAFPTKTTGTLSAPFDVTACSKFRGKWNAP